MEKMCTVRTVIGKGYKTDVEFIDGKCLTTKEFLNDFSKENYSFSISGDRAANQLFPYSDVVETFLEKTPSIQFTYPEVTLKYSEFEFENPFTVENLTGLTVSVNGSTDDAEAFFNEDNVVFYLPSDSENNTADDYQYTVTVTGTRVDGQGTYSKSFTVTRKYFAVDILFSINSGLGTGLKTQYIPMSNNVISGDMSDYEVYLANGRNSKGDPVEYEDGKYSSGSWEFMFDDQRSFDYTMSKIGKDDGKPTTENSPSNVSGLMFSYDDYKAYSKVVVAVKPPTKQPIQIILRVSDNLGTDVSDWSYRTNTDANNWEGSFTTMASGGTSVTIEPDEVLQIKYSGTKSMDGNVNLRKNNSGLSAAIMTDNKLFAGYDSLINGSHYVITK